MHTSTKLSKLHISATIVHTTIGFVILTLVINNKGEKWPIINRGWLTDSKYSYHISYLLPMFPLLSAINHLLTIIKGSSYVSVLDKGVNSWRWIEYSVSAGFMLWIVSSLSGILEIRSLVAMMILNVALQYHGFLIEQAVANGAGKKQIMRLLVSAWLIHMCIWVQIFISFFSVVNRNSDIPNRPAIYSIIIVLFFLFTLFGVVSTLWALRLIVSFQLVETLYSILSLTAKVLLTLMTYFGVLRSRGTENS